MVREANVRTEFMLGNEFDDNSASELRRIGALLAVALRFFGAPIGEAPAGVT